MNYLDSDNRINSLGNKNIEEFSNKAISKNNFEETGNIYCKNITAKVITEIGIIDKVLPLQKIKQRQPIAFIIELGSNANALENLYKAREIFNAMCSNAVWSTEYQNPDYTATLSNPKPDYTNQCGYLTFATSPFNERHVINNVVKGSLESVEKPTIGQVLSMTKAIEKEIQRQFFNGNPLQSNPHGKDKSILSMNKNRQVIIDIDLLAIKIDNKIIALEERYPFKNHECVGVVEIYEKGYLS